MVNKPPHLVVHPTKPTPVPTLLDELEQLLVYEKSTGGQLAIITRLDRETSGIVLIAKTAEAASLFSKAMQNREFRKTYQAIAWGWPEVDTFEVDAPILRQRDVKESEIWVKQTVDSRGKPSRTQFRVLKRFENSTAKETAFSLIECQPVTGRTHQIRVHLQHAGFPIVGDKIYGPDERYYPEFINTGWTPKLEQALLLNRQALHAGILEWKDHRWVAPLPRDMIAFLPVSDQTGFDHRSDPV